MSDATGATPGDQVATTQPSPTPTPDAITWTGIVLLTLYFLLVSISSSYALIKIWPPTADSAASSHPTNIPDTVMTSEGPHSASGGTTPDFPRDGGNAAALFWGKVRLDFGGREGLRLLFIALLSGALGAFISSAMSFASYLGNRQFDRSWGIWYLVRPPVGMVLALIVYFLLRGGLLSPGAGVSSVSSYGVAGISGLMGMFVKEATDKMRDVAAALFQSRQNERRNMPLIQDEKHRADVTSGTGSQTAPVVHQYDPGA